MLVVPRAPRAGGRPALAPRRPALAFCVSLPLLRIASYLPRSSSHRPVDLHHSDKGLQSESERAADPRYDIHIHSHFTFTIRLFSCFCLLGAPVSLISHREHVALTRLHGARHSLAHWRRFSLFLSSCGCGLLPRSAKVDHYKCRYIMLIVLSSY